MIFHQLFGEIMLPGGLLQRLAGSAIDKEAALDHFLMYGLYAAYR